MQKHSFLLKLAGSICLLAPIAAAHGGQYRGPGDTVPPGGSGAGGAGGPASGPLSGPGGPGSPGGVGSPRGPGGLGGPGSIGGPASAGAGDLGSDLTLWSFWWEFNKAPYLNLKAAIHAGGPTTGSAGYFLGIGETDQSKDSLAPSQAHIRQKVVPALLAALERETNNDIVTACLIALAKIGDERDDDGDSVFEKNIAEFLTDANQEISETAAVALGILANDRSIETLQHLLDDDSEGRKLVGRGKVHFRTRAFAAYGLGLIGARTVQEQRRQEIVAILVAAIASDDTKSRDLKTAAIISMGLVPLETIEQKSLPAEGEARLAHLSRNGQIDYLMAFLADDSNKFLVRAHVPTALARLLEGIPGVGQEDSAYSVQKQRIATALLDLFDKRSKESNEVIQSAVLAMGLIGDADSDPIDARIRTALAQVPKDHSNIQTRNFSLISMAKVGSNPGNGHDLDRGIQQAAEFLLKQLSRGKSGVQPWAGLGVGVMGRRLTENKIGSRVIVDLSLALRTSLEDERNPDSLGAYAIGAGILDDRDSHPVLLEKFDETTEPQAQGYIALALGLSNVRSAIEPIKRVIKESKYKPKLLNQAAVALGLLGDSELVDDLTDMLRKAKSLSTQAAISSALGTIGDTHSIDPLIEMLEDDQLTELARSFAAVALGIVSDKEPLPWNSKIALDLNYRASTSTLTDTISGTGILDIR